MISIPVYRNEYVYASEDIHVQEYVYVRHHDSRARPLLRRDTAQPNSLATAA